MRQGRARAAFQLIVGVVGGGVVAIGFVVGSGVGGGLLSVWLLSSGDDENRPTAASLADLVHFVPGAIVGGAAGLAVVIGVLGLVSRRAGSAFRPGRRHGG
jgi:hypothetical protein